jgi:hypothetical protein
MGLRLRAPIKVVNTHVEIANSVNAAGNAANVLAQSVMEPLLSG